MGTGVCVHNRREHVPVVLPPFFRACICFFWPAKSGRAALVMAFFWGLAFVAGAVASLLTTEPFAAFGAVRAFALGAFVAFVAFGAFFAPPFAPAQHNRGVKRHDAGMSFETSDKTNRRLLQPTAFVWRVRCVEACVDV